jgi:dephospho-CoA kinase
VLGLTGGIGAGKSTVARMLAARGAAVIDADAVAREVVQPGGAAYGAVVERFGREVVRGDGTIDRRALAGIVFGDELARTDLNAIVHPAVAEGIRGRLANLPASSVAVVEVPLLVEAGWAADVVVVVDAPLDVAARRVVDGRGMGEAEVRQRMAVQATPEERHARADYVIDNGGPLSDLDAQVDRLWAELGARGPAQGS